MNNKLNIYAVTSADRIRALCIREGWYTNGTISEYENLLNFVGTRSILDDESLERIAMDIYSHSNDTKFDANASLYENLSNIKFWILNDASTIRLNL